MRTSVVPSVVGITALLLAQACGSSTSAAPPSRTSIPSPPGTIITAGVSVSLELAQTTVTAGTEILATLLIDNRTGKPIKSGCGLHYAVGITSAQIPFQPAFTLECRINQSIAPGVTRFQASIITTYPSCSQSGQPDGATPGCLPGPMGAGSRFTLAPPLPRGTYRTAVVLDGIPTQGLRLPAPRTVTLR